TGEGDGELNVAVVSRVSGPPEAVSGLSSKKTLPERSDCRPALASAGSRLFLAWTGQGDGNLNLLTSPAGGTTWGDKFTFDETSSHGPALASHDGELFLAWKGSGNENLNVARVDFAAPPPAPPTVTGLSKKVIFDETSDYGPALASHVSQGALLFL